uniref:DUF1725 domain-containing protein n=1 Tax=Felis catus TaxID=9685 RepID=A0ABI7Y598_FELCA
MCEIEDHISVLCTRTQNPIIHLIQIIGEIKMPFIDTMEYYLAMRKNEILPFATTWMELEGIMLSEVSQPEKDRYHMFSLICGS